MLVEEKYCSQGDISGKRSPKKYFIKSLGNYLYDDTGTKYLDMQMYNSAANFGYQNKTFKDILIDQVDKLPGLASEFMNESRVLLSEKICKYMEDNYNIKGRVHFSVGGAQAVDDALKLVTNYTGTKSIFSFEGGYHGRTMAASSVSSSYRYKRQFGSVFDIYRIPYPCCEHCAYNKKVDSCNLFCVSQFERLFESEFYGVYDPVVNKVSYGAMIAEPVLGRGGYVVPPINYFSKIKEILDKYGILLVADEVQMGFYRTGKLWSFEHFEIIPDIIVFGKAVSNGLWPLSGIWAKEDLISPEKWPTGSTHSTYSGHPIGTSLGLGAFKIIENPDFIPKIKQSSEYLNEVVKNIKRDFKIIGRTDILGHAIGIEIIDPDTQKPNMVLAKKLSETALNKPININGSNYGLVLTVGGIFNNSLMLSPSLFMSKEDIDIFDNLFRQYIKNIL
jgi:4-aminobutyrate aminotransferase-like enzyme